MNVKRCVRSRTKSRKGGGRNTRTGERSPGVSFSFESEANAKSLNISNSSLDLRRSLFPCGSGMVGTMHSVVCGAVGAQGSEATFSGEVTRVTGAPASGESLQNLLGDDDEPEADEEVSGEFSLLESHPSKDEKKKRKGRGKKRNKQKSKSTTPLGPVHSFYTSGHTSTLSTTQDPCTSTHLSFCIHGYCKYIEGLQEPVCICMKGYDGARCGIQSLETIKTKSGPINNTEQVQTVLVIIAVVLSIISCTAILLMTCAHYRSHKNFLASYLGTGTEQEKLKKPTGDVVV